jgi:alkaline phosphatase
MNRATGLAIGVLIALSCADQATAQPVRTGNVIFVHPDGTGLNHWQALRMAQAGPDGLIEWDQLPFMAVYTGHAKDQLAGTSHGGATMHAYGVKVVADSFGMDGKEPLIAASGKPMSIAEEAIAAGKAVALVQSGHIAEPGTAAFVASVPSRRDYDEIARQVIESGATVIMAGGERYLLPEGAQGRHCQGRRKDGVDLIARAKELGYTIVFTRNELRAVNPATTERLLGVFACNHTFNDEPEERNRLAGREPYGAEAPTIAEMAEVALAVIARDPDGFFAVIEEEGTDNFSNAWNARGALEALARADAMIGVVRRFVEQRGDTLMLVAADSDAGGLQVISDVDVDMSRGVPLQTPGGARLWGVQGTFGEAFQSAPDRQGRRHPFAITYLGTDDVVGGILVRAHGINADQLKPVMDNTDLYRLMHATLFGSDLYIAAR